MNPMQNPYGQQPPMQPEQAIQPGMQSQALDPALMQAILQLQMQNPQQAGLRRSQRQADMMRGDASQQLQGRTVGAKGRELYVPPNALNLAANVMGNRRAQGIENDIGVREQNAAAQKQDALRRYFEGITGQRRPALGHMGDEGE